MPSKDILEFEKDTHTYKINGKPATGVTSVISALAKPNLIPWAARMAVEYVKENWDITFAPDKTLWEEVLAEAQVAHLRKKEAAGTHGTDAHALVEEWIKAYMIGHGYPLRKHDDRFKVIDPFIEWADQNVDHFTFAERQMFNKELFIAGTADFGCVMKDGKKLIGDWKTSSGVYGVDYFLQCAGYKILAEGEGDTPYDGCVIVRLGKKGPEDFDVTYRYDTTADEEGFRACLTLYRLQATYVKPNNN